MRPGGYVGGAISLDPHVDANGSGGATVGARAEVEDEADVGLFTGGRGEELGDYDNALDGRDGAVGGGVDREAGPVPAVICLSVLCAADGLRDDAGIGDGKHQGESPGGRDEVELHGDCAVNEVRLLSVQNALGSCWCFHLEVLVVGKRRVKGGVQEEGLYIHPRQSHDVPSDGSYHWTAPENTNKDLGHKGHRVFPI